MQKKNFLCFGLGTYQEKLAKSSKEYSNNNIVIEYKKKFLKKNKNLIDQLVIGSVYDYQNISNILKKIKKKFLIDDIIFRSSGPAIISAYKVCKKIKSKRINKDLAYCVYSKNYFFNFLKRKKIIKKKELNNLDHYNTKQYVIKPDAPIIGKKGIVKTNKVTKKIINYIASFSHNNKTHISKFIDGSDISVVILKNKKDKKNFILNYINEINYFGKNSFLSNKAIIGYYKIEDEDIKSKLYTTTKQIIRHFPNYYGFLIISYRVNKSQIFPYEINIGMAGDNYAEKIFPFFYKNNIYDLEIKNLMNSNLKLIRRKNKNFIGLIKDKKFFSRKKLIKLLKK